MTLQHCGFLSDDLTALSFSAAWPSCTEVSNYSFPMKLKVNLISPSHLISSTQLRKAGCVLIKRWLRLKEKYIYHSLVSLEPDKIFWTDSTQ